MFKMFFILFIIYYKDTPLFLILQTFFGIFLFYIYKYMKYLLTWEKLNEKFNIDDNLVKEYFDDYFLDVLEDPSIKKSDFKFGIINYAEKNGDKFRKHTDIALVGDYLEYTWSIKLVGDFNLDDFKSRVNAIDKKMFIITKEKFEKTQSYLNGVEKNQISIVFNFIYNKQIELPEQINDFIGHIEKIGYVRKSNKNATTNIHLSKKIDYKIKTDLTEDFIKKIPHNSNRQLKEDFVKDLNKEINELIDKEIEPIYNFLGSKFVPSITYSEYDLQPFKTKRYYTTIRLEKTKSFIYFSIKYSIKEDGVYISDVFITIENEELR
jgi:hypothetical protein